ncbi:MAG: prolyl oligopeptidase family serine peptidase [Alphaproteobacteria bacterium]|nr:prolyl oligopeptidase family serine peptidase [Alphaproteobacteria bacterium]
MHRRDILKAGAAMPLAALIPAACASTTTETSALPQPPVARRDPKTIEQLGRVRVDEYHWLKDADWQAVMRDPTLLRADIRDYLVAENAYREEVMASTAALQETLFQEMRGRIKEDDSTVPAGDGPWDYFARFQTGAQHPQHLRRPRNQTGPEQILLDVEAQAQGKDYYDVGAVTHSPDHRLFAYALDEQGSEYFTIRIKDLETGQELASAPDSTTGDFVFTPDSQFLFWIFRDENGRPTKVYRRPARGSADDDVLVYEEEDEGFFIGLGVTASRAFITISCGNQEQSETWLIPAADPTAAPACFHSREAALLYDLTHWQGRWHIRTNADGAVDFKVMVCAESATGRANWRDLLPHTPGRFILGVGAYKDFLVRLERVNALPRIVIRDAGGAEHTVAQDEEAYDIEFGEGFEFDTSVTRFVYQSPTTPRQWFDYDMRTRERTLRKTQEIPSGHDPARYETRRFMARAPDGADVPVTVLMLRGTLLDGSAPMLLYGYGSYGISIDADFSIRRFSLVDRGWVFAVAHVRGGAEKGWGWFLDGRKFDKKNTFTDFIACAEALVARGYSAPGRIVAEGRSAGGLLMGAINNMRPDLWAGVIGGVPFVDVLNTMSDTSLPLTPPEWPEWGNPLEDAAAYDYIASYCPYTNVERKAYPAVLATGGLSDPRVTYWEPAKWAAKLRPHTTSGRPILLKINMEAGHAGATGRFDYLKEIAHDYAFALKAVGAAEAGGGF